MESPSILNDVLGPVMRGPSSSHTAGSYHIGRTLRDLLGDEPARAAFTFDPGGSYARTYRQQGVDLALASGLMGWGITDPRFAAALDEAVARGLVLKFRTAPLRGADHPNTVAVELASRRGKRLTAVAKSTGGGSFVVTELDGWPVRVDGKAYQVFVRGQTRSKRGVERLVVSSPRWLEAPVRRSREGEFLLSLRLTAPPAAGFLDGLESVPGVSEVRSSAPVYFVQSGKTLFASAAEMTALARRKRWSTGRSALAYEAALLCLQESAIAAEILGRYALMKESVEVGLKGRGLRMQLLRPTAGKIWRADRSGRLAAGGLHARAAARALAAMHVSNSAGVVCAAPTGGSAGVIPAVITTLDEEWRIPEEAIVRSLMAAGAVGLILAKRATFAAEVAGCQVEIGAAGAMAAAAVVEAKGGTVLQACDAAAIAFQNTMGSVCDLLHGTVEIPCHTRNAAAAAAAFVNADLILGGYRNLVPLDETIDAVFAVGLAMPAELRCTSKGGLAVTPSAKNLKPCCAQSRHCP